MSKLGCLCGHVIRDQSDSLPYKAAFIRDRDDQFLFDQITKDAAKFTEAASVEGMAPHIAAQLPDGASITATELFVDRISSAFAGLASDMYECESCGRIWLQKKGTNTFVSFKPDEGDYHAVLAV
ncbi:hypothetical protein GTP41_26090 [Pseudoduganella sp. DS3]|uniref:Uncharacterized protein n=1 Tax=Pseudoduganella guangdongensis TaxID=2692179 RepID=A0A6N9HQF7_9BURK|nr:hypothetical protein [Pseudoduganella guangdongensis]MYN05567.1 hypothetical protein [Pseudoduganella guangdongensis]